MSDTNDSGLPNANVKKKKKRSQRLKRNTEKENITELNTDRINNERCAIRTARSRFTFHTFLRAYWKLNGGARDAAGRGSTRFHWFYDGGVHSSRVQLSKARDESGEEAGARDEVRHDDGDGDVNDSRATRRKGTRTGRRSNKAEKGFNGNTVKPSVPRTIHLRASREQARARARASSLCRLLASRASRWRITPGIRLFRYPVAAAKALFNRSASAAKSVKRFVRRSRLQRVNALAPGKGVFPPPLAAAGQTRC